MIIDNVIVIHRVNVIDLLAIQYSYSLYHIEFDIHIHIGYC